MRKIVLLFCSVSVFSLFASAQITKGSKLLGGGISFGRTKNDPTNSTGLTRGASSSVNFSAGSAIKENLIVGGSLFYGHGSAKYTYNSSSAPITVNKSNTYGAGAFARRYFPLGKNFYLFGQTSLNFGINNQEYLSGNTETSETKGWNISLGAAPGISYALTRKFQLELGFNDLASIYYGKSVTENSGPGATSKSKGSSYGLSTSLGTSTPLNIGFRILLQK